MWHEILRWIVLALALGPFGYYILAITAARRFFKNRPPISKDFAPPVSVLKPVRGLDREAYENYASFCRQEYPDFEIIFGVTEETDPAVPVIQQLIHDFPQCKIRLLIGAPPLGTGDKVNKLCRMVREAKHDILIISDSDVRVEPGFLRAVVAPFCDPTVGGVTCLYRGITDGGLAADLEALGNSTDFAQGVLVAWLLAKGSLDFMLGAVMATRKECLVHVGGLEALVDYFCDDYELGNRLAACGYRVELSPVVVDIVYPRETFREALRHQLRWNLSIRHSSPRGHFGLLFTQILIWSLIGFTLSSTWSGSLGFIAGYVLLRHAAAVVIGAHDMKDKLVQQRIGILWLRDFFAFFVWLLSFFPQRIRWRDGEFYVQNKRLVRTAPLR